MPIWKDESRQKVAQENIKFLIAAWNGNGWPITWANSFALAGLVACSVRKSGLNNNLVRQVLQKMIASNQDSIADFEVGFEKLKKLTARTAQTWKIFIPIAMELHPDLELPLHLKMLGVTFKFMTLQQVDKHLSSAVRQQIRDPNYIKLHTGATNKKTPDLFWYISVNAQSFDEAWNAISPALDALRGNIEMCLNLYRMRILGSRPSARRVFPQSLWMLCQKDKNEPHWRYFINDEVLDAKPHKLSKENFLAIVQNCKPLIKTPSEESTLSVISDCFRLYSQAMDARFPYDSFLGFWQVIEGVVQSESLGGDTKKVIGRVHWHHRRYKLASSGFRETLLDLAELRNDLVHRGLRDVTEDQVNFAKFAAEAALTWLFYVCKFLPTKLHLEQFYKLKDVSPQQLKIIQETLNYIKLNTQSKQAQKIKTKS